LLEQKYEQIKMILEAFCPFVSCHEAFIHLTTAPQNNEFVSSGFF